MQVKVYSRCYKTVGKLKVNRIAKGHLIWYSIFIIYGFGENKICPWGNISAIKVSHSVSDVVEKKEDEE